MSALPTKADICSALGPLWANIVAKVGEEQANSKNAQQSNRVQWIFGSTLRTGADLESMLLARMRKILLQQYRPDHTLTYSITARASS
jgi:hypothetical protein